MEYEERLKAFEEPLSYIKDEKVKEFAKKAIGLLPDYFFEIPASSTGKYHPAYSLGEGGLYRHTMAVVRVGIELFRLDWWNFTPIEEDLLIVAMMLHDGWKSGREKTEFSITKHPLVATEVLSEDEELMNILFEEQTDIILSSIKTHMGQWTRDYRTNEEVLERPKNRYQKFVHLSDYIASRKCLTMEFSVPLSR